MPSGPPRASLTSAAFVRVSMRSEPILVLTRWQPTLKTFEGSRDFISFLEKEILEEAQSFLRWLMQQMT
jgi:hypothetical protein